MNFFRVLILLLIGMFLGFLPTSAVAESTKTSWIDQSYEALLPSKVDRKVLGFRDFPVFWWNFLVLQFEPGKEIPWGPIRQKCERQFLGLREQVRRSACEGLDGSFKELLAEWSRDYVLRHPMPKTHEVENSYDQVLGKASLPIGRNLIETLRLDPFNALEEFQRILNERDGLAFENRQGLFWDAKSGRLLIPFQMKEPASRSDLTREVFAQTEDFCEGLGCQRSFLGPHFSSLENEMQIKEDLQVVSMIGWPILALLGLFFFFTKRVRLLLVFIPTAIAIVLATVITYLIFGKIHGLTLSFGPSIVGLAIDYGIHWCFSDEEDESVWPANFFGLLTTLSIFVVLFFSELPLLKQISSFSIVGLGVSFGLLYCMDRFFPHYFHLKPYRIHPPRARWPVILSVVFLVCGLATPFVMKPNLSLQSLNFETPLTAEIRTWLFVEGKSVSPLIRVHTETDAEVVRTSAEEKAWSDQQGVSYQGMGQYLPSREIQEQNLQSWSEVLCGSRSEAVEEFFAPFWKKFSCEGRSPKIDGLNSTPNYVLDFKGKDQWVSLWFPTNLEQASEVTEKFTGISSFADILAIFAKVLQTELNWMVPCALLLAYVFLLLYYKSFFLSLSAVVPFFTGLGCFFAVASLSGMSISFTSVVGLVMVFGFSIDYGIFVTDLISAKEIKHDESVWSAVVLAAISNLAGFFPLMFASHPAMKHLGEALFLGTLGTCIGAIFGVPGVHRYLAKKERIR